MTTTRFMTAAAATLAIAAAPAAGQDTWSWNGSIPAGQSIEIKGVNGAIRAVAATGSEARVTATRTARRSNTAEVRLEVIEHSGGVTICAVYPSRSDREPNECRPGSGGRMNVQNNDVRVAFEVQVPRGVNFVGRTVNGDIEATGIAASARGFTVNGGVTMDAIGIAHGRTVNGDIEVTMGRSDWTDRLEFETVNGSIVVTFMNDLNATVSASTVNGGIETDFPLEVRGRFGPRRVTGTIGSGGRDLALSTVNGSIELRRGR
jgi:hypothetical protein